MVTSHLTAQKLKKIHAAFLLDYVNVSQTSRELEISRNTLKKHLTSLTQLSQSYPDRILDTRFCVAALKAYKRPNELKKHLTEQFPILLDQADPYNLSCQQLWATYKEIYPEGYTYSQFCFYFSDWRREHEITIGSGKYKIKHIAEADLIIFKKVALFQ